MAKVSIDAPAPDFELADYKGNQFKLSSYKNKKNVVLIFNRGFM